jgi:hypothetical protein
MTYVRLVNGEDAARFQRALRPGGIFVYENNNAGVPNELLRAFLGFRILRFEDVDAYTDWHPDKKQRVERLIGERTEVERKDVSNLAASQAWSGTAARANRLSIPSGQIHCL